MPLLHMGLPFLLSRRVIETDAMDRPFPCRYQYSKDSHQLNHPINGSMIVATRLRTLSFLVYNEATTDTANGVRTHPSRG
jgi:hypothetical protein